MSMYLKHVITATFIVMVAWGCVTAQMCPFDTSSTQEAAQPHASGEIVNSGNVGGFVSSSTSVTLGTTGEVAGYTSAEKTLLGKGGVSLATFTNYTPGYLSSQAAFSLPAGRVTYSESAAYDYCTPNASCCETTAPFCEAAVSSMSTSLTTGKMATELSVVSLSTTNMLNHGIAVGGAGTMDAYAGYSLVTANGTTSVTDRMTALGKIDFGRVVTFKSIRV